MAVTAEFKSDWISVNNSQTQTIKVAHGLTTPPELFIMIFSPEGPGPNGEDPAMHYFSQYRWYGDWAQNPVTVKADATHFHLAVTENHPIFSAYGYDHNRSRWQTWNSGYIQIMAFDVVGP